MEYGVEVDVVKVEMVAVEAVVVGMEVEVTNSTLLTLSNQITLGALLNFAEPEVLE
uniref:Uncharacterized protein n=1 Tax=Cucumis melo TaxID=3656 RepID=A0A9I9CKE0_CUCME